MIYYRCLHTQNSLLIIFSDHKKLFLKQDLSVSWNKIELPFHAVSL